MDKRSKIALYSIGAIVLFMIIAEIVKPKAINWRDSYSSQDKIPLGCYVMYNELQTFSEKDIITSTKDFYQFQKEMDTTINSTTVFVNNYVSIYGEEADAVLNYVSQGNSVLISTLYFSGKIADTLNANIRKDYNNFLKKKTTQRFTSPSLKDNTKAFNDVIENSYLTSVDSLNTTVLGYVYNEETETEEVNFVKINFGDNGGVFYIHSNPYAFTNYHLLNDKEDYTAGILSYLPRQQIIWDNYYKTGRRVVKSPLRYILNQNALKWAFYLALLAIILFVIFKGKRTQRIVPVIKPLENTTVEFTKTIGGLYFQHKEYSNIINKKILFFLEQIRTQYYLNTNNLNSEFVEKLALKASKTIEETKEIIDLIKFLKQKGSHTENDLIVLNKKLEAFNKTNP